MIVGTSHATTLTSLSRRAESLSSQIATLQAQASSGLSVTRPSDSPTLTSSIMGLDAQAGKQEVWQANSSYAMSLLDGAEHALSQIADLISRARELAVQYSSEALTAEDRANAVGEVEGLLAQAISLANTDIGGRHLFSGNATDTAPFDDDGTYQGDTGSPSARVGESAYVAVGWDGSSIFGDGDGLIETLSALAAALETDDVDELRASIDDLDEASRTVSDARTGVAAQFNNADDALVMAENMATLLGTMLDDMAGIDEVTVYTRLSEAQATYQAVLQVMSTTASGGLFALL